MNMKSIDFQQANYNIKLKISLMQEPVLSENRKRGVYNLFAIISTLLSLGHFVVLEFSVTLAKEIDDAQSPDPRSIPDWNAKQNIPFAAILGIFAAAQFCSSLAIVILNRKGSARTLYYNSLLGLLVSFAVGVSLTILASEYNSLTRIIPKDQDVLPTIMPFYWATQVDATATFLFSVPMLLFIFYYNLEDYLKQQRDANSKTTLPGQALNKLIWLLALFVLNSLAHVAFIYNIYQFTGIENPETYNLDDLADQYTFYIAVEVAVTLFALIMQIKHFQHSFLKKNQVILLATLTAVFQLGSFILMAIKAVQLHLDISLMDGDNCYFPDCEESKTFRWEITGYSILTWFALVAQIPYFRAISKIQEEDKGRDTLLTQENYQS